MRDVLILELTYHSALIIHWVDGTVGSLQPGQAGFTDLAVSFTLDGVDLYLPEDIPLSEVRSDGHTAMVYCDSFSDKKSLWVLPLSTLHLVAQTKGRRNLPKGTILVRRLEYADPANPSP